MNKFQNPATYFFEVHDCSVYHFTPTGLWTLTVGDEIDIITKDHMIIIKPKSMTDRVRSLVMLLPLIAEFR